MHQPADTNRRRRRQALVMVGMAVLLWLPCLAAAPWLWQVWLPSADGKPLSDRLGEVGPVALGGLVLFAAPLVASAIFVRIGLDLLSPDSEESPST